MIPRTFITRYVLYCASETLLQWITSNNQTNNFALQRRKEEPEGQITTRKVSEGESERILASGLLTSIFRFVSFDCETQITFDPNNETKKGVSEWGREIYFKIAWLVKIPPRRINDPNSFTLLRELADRSFFDGSRRIKINPRTEEEIQSFDAILQNEWISLYSPFALRGIPSI